MADTKKSFALLFRGFQTKKAAAGDTVVTGKTETVSSASGNFQALAAILLPAAGMMLLTACAGAPKTTGPQYAPWHYTYSILYAPASPDISPETELAMSLVEMKYPADQAKFFNNILYSAATMDEYKDRIIGEQRDRYRAAQYTPAEETGDEIAGEDTADESVPAPTAVTETAEAEAETPSGETAAADESETEEQIVLKYPLNAGWRYAETVSVKNTQYRGIMVEREFDTYTGGAHGFRSKQYYMLDMEAKRLIKIDDLFTDYQGDLTRAVIYTELRKHASLTEDEPLSQGGFLSDEPELSFNFFFTEQGIGFHWDPYEVMPYSAGSLEVIIPWRTIRPLLLHSGMELLTKFNIYLFV